MPRLRTYTQPTQPFLVLEQFLKPTLLWTGLMAPVWRACSMYPESNSCLAWPGHLAASQRHFNMALAKPGDNKKGESEDPGNKPGKEPEEEGAGYAM